MNQTKFQDWFNCGEDAQSMLDAADLKARSRWEMDFMDLVRRRWEQYGMGGFLSEAQYETLRRLSGDKA